ALPVLGGAVHALDGAGAPFLDVTAPTMPSTSHSSTPYDVGQDRQADGPVHHEAEHHQRNPGQLAEVVYAGDDLIHRGTSPGSKSQCECLLHLHRWLTNAAASRGGSKSVIGETRDYGAGIRGQGLGRATGDELGLQDIRERSP